MKMTTNTCQAATTQACPVVRDFRVVDMDQSDNVDTTYLLIGGTKLAQNTPANAKAAGTNAEGKPSHSLSGLQVVIFLMLTGVIGAELSNGSDNALVNDFIEPTMGCSTFTVPSITAPNGQSAGLSLNVSSPAHQKQDNNY